MDSKITLPPISDIFYSKENGLAPLPSLPRLSPSIPMVPLYPQQYGPPNTVGKYASVPSFSVGAYTAAPPVMSTLVTLPRSMQGGVGAPSAPMVERQRSTSEPRWSSLGASSPQLEAPVSPAAPSGTRSARSRTRNNLPKETTYILLKWLNEHLNHPYPNSFEKTRLMMATGLNQQQLSNWFINARRRKIKGLRQKKLEV